MLCGAALLFLIAILAGAKGGGVLAAGVSGLAKLLFVLGRAERCHHDDRRPPLPL